MWARPKISDVGELKLDHQWAQALSPAQSTAILAAAMLSDGKVDAKEEGYLKAYAKQNGVTEQTVQATLAACRAGQLKIPMPRSLDETAACLKGFVRMSLADGKLSDEETKLIVLFASKLSLREPQVLELIKKERLALYREAKKGVNVA
jgi:hypothetical protein